MLSSHLKDLDWSAQILAVAAAYFLAGKIGLLLAIPPGYATVVWPPSGIALAGLLLFGNRAWPGVFLGSFLVNTTSSLDASSFDALERSVVLAGAIGIGATLQALVGSYLIQRFSGYSDDTLGDERAVARLLVLGGPMSCLVNATFAVSVLWLSGVVSAEAVLANWWTWWVGDTLGVLIFTPLLLAWAVTKKNVSWRKKIAISIPFFVAFIVLVALLFYSTKAEKIRLRKEFNKSSAVIAQALESELSAHVRVLSEAEKILMQSPAADKDEFHTFAMASLVRHDQIQTLAWIPEGPGERFIEPPSVPDKVAVFDKDDAKLRPALTPAMKKARATSRPAAADPDVMTQNGHIIRGATTVAIAHFISGQSETPSQNRPGGGPVGYILENLKLDPILDSILGPLQTGDITVVLYDDALPGLTRCLYGAPMANLRPFVNEITIEFAGRPWRLIFAAALPYVLTHRSLFTWGVLAGLSLIVGSLGAWLLIKSFRLQEASR